MSLTYNTFPVVYLVTSLGRIPLNNNGDERLIDLLQRNNVPWSAISIYTVPSSGGRPILASCLELMLSEFPDISEILLYYNRNINPLIFSFDEFEIMDSETPSVHSTEYFYQLLNNSKSNSEIILRKLSPDECKSIIADRVGEMIRSSIPYGAKIVVGVSGGGEM